jgi:hypothetical protein
MAWNRVSELDRETVVETIVEIATSGAYVRDAEVLLREELAAYGYSPLESDRVAGVCRTIADYGEPRAIACALHQVLLDRETLVSLLDSEILVAACMMIQR